jgi:hypothetical protein
VTPKERAEKLLSSNWDQCDLDQYQCDLLVPHIERAIEAAVAEERKRCAEIARRWSVYRWVDVTQIKGEKTISGKENYERLAKAIEEGE